MPGKSQIWPVETPPPRHVSCNVGVEMTLRAGYAPLYALAVLLSAGPLTCTGADSGNEVWNWLNLDLWDNERWRVHLYMDNRTAQHRGSYIQVVSPRFKYRLRPWLDLGLGLTLLHIERGDTNDFFPQPRPEFEINPRWAFGEHWKFHSRNRWEIRWNDWEGKPRHRSRHRLQLRWEASDVGFFRGLFTNNEWFIEYDRGGWTENRWIPFGASFRLSSKVTLHLFYMKRSFWRSGAWTHDHVGGTFLNVKF